VKSVTEGADDADTNRRDMDVVERPSGYFESSGLTRLAGRLRCRSVPTPRESTGQRSGGMQTVPANGAWKSSALGDTANTPGLGVAAGDYHRSLDLSAEFPATVSETPRVVGDIGRLSSRPNRAGRQPAFPRRSGGEVGTRSAPRAGAERRFLLTIKRASERPRWPE